MMNNQVGTSEKVENSLKFLRHPKALNNFFVLFFGRSFNFIENFAKN
jgi:hypothetical protein